MLVKPDQVRTVEEYERTPAGVERFINDQLMGRVWVVGEAQVIRLPKYLASCGSYSAWQEVVHAMRSAGWEVSPSIRGFTKDRIQHVDLRVTKTG